MKQETLAKLHHVDQHMTTIIIIVIIIIIIIIIISLNLNVMTTL